MTRSGIAFIGQKRTVNGLSGYGLGDAQIDAQNRVTSDIGQVLVAFDATNAAGQLTASYIQSAINQIQGFINTYANQYAGTSRGEAGRKTLQTFVDTKIFPSWRDMLANMSAPVDTSIYTGAPPSTPVNSGVNPGTVVNINSGGTSAGATNAMQPSNTPNSPSGIQIPGYETTVTASAPAWYESPYVIAVGVGLLFLLMRKK